MNTYRLWSMRILILIALAALLALFAVTPARAADVRGGDTVVIGRGEVIEDDLYVTSSSVVIDGVVKGDLVAFGGQITVNGTIAGDLLAVGQSVVINGVVGDDVRAAGQAIVLGPSARVAGDLVTAGLSTETRPGSVVQGDLMSVGYQALLAGDVGKNVRGGMNRMELRGTIGGNVDVTVSGEQNASAVQFSPAGQTPLPSVQPNLTVADSARIGGKLRYRSSAEGVIAPTAQLHGVAFDRQVAPAAPAPVIPGLSYLQQLVGLLLAGLLLLWLTPAWTRRMADSVETQPLLSLGRGLLAFGAFLGALLVILIATILLAICFGYLTLGGLAALVVGVGLLAGVALTLGYVTFAAYIAAAIVGFMAGRWLLRRVQPAWAEQPVVTMIVGLALYVLLSAIPWLGGVVGLLVVLLALGALWEWGRATFQLNRPAAARIGGLQPA